jgi:glucose uptake protein
MFQPTSFPVGLIFALIALACWGSWSTTLVIASKTMAWECFYFDFAFSFLVTGIVVGFIIGCTPGNGGSQSDPFSAYTQELFQYSAGCYGYSMLGGLMWNMANVLLCKGIGLMGQALGFPMCVGLGLISGSLTNYIIDGDGTNLSLLLVGDFLALLGICAVGFLAKRKEDELAARSVSLTNDTEAAIGETLQVPMMRKFIICLVGGLLLGLSNIGVVNATNGLCSMSAPANQTFFSIGMFLSSAILVPLSVWFPVEGGAATTSLAKLAAKYKEVGTKEHCLSILGGFLLCIGFFAYNLGNATKLGSAPTYSIGQSAPVVGILWGSLFFKEFHGTSPRVWGIIPVIVALFIGAIICLAFSG